MSNTNIRIIFVTTWVMVIHGSAICQNLKYSFDTIVDKNDTLLINTTDYRGVLKWQHSYNGQNWNDIDQGNDLYSFSADTIMLIRAKVEERNCINPWYSDTILINFKPIIERVEPNTGVIGDTIQLIGKNFNVYSNQTIDFNDIYGNIITFNDSIIETQLPFEIDSASINIKLSLYNTHDNYTFKLLPPEVNKTAPDTLSIGDIVSISGDNFALKADYNFVKTGINNFAEVVYALRDSLRFILPEGSYSKRNTTITICVGGQCDSLENEIYIDDAWLRKGDAPSGQFGRYYATGFQIGNHGYLGLGLGLGFEAANDFWKYDYLNDKWIRISDFPGGPRTHAISFVINDIAYVGGGNSDSYGSQTKDFWKYDSSSDQWVQVSDLPIINNAGICAFSIEDKGYIITREAENNFWAYSPVLDEWELLPDFIPNDNYNAYADIACVINNKAYVLTSNGSTGIDEVWEFNPNTNIWERKADQIADDLFYNGRSIFVINDEAYLFPDAYHNVFSKYNPVNDEWFILTQAKPGGRNYGVVFVFEDKAYFGTGTYFSSSYSDFWEYDPLLE